MPVTIGNLLLSKLKPCEKPYDVRDDRLTGFFIRVNISGKMLYMCEYTRGKRIVIGKVGVLTPVQARDKAKEVLADYTKGVDPKSVRKTQKTTTFRDFIQSEYSPWFSANHKSPKSLENLKHFVVAFGDKPLNEINSFLVEKWKVKRFEKKVAVSTVNRNLVGLKAVFSKALEWGFIDNNPLQKLKLARVDDISKIRYLMRDEEIRLREAISQREEKVCVARENGNSWRRERGYPEKPSFQKLPFADYIKPMILISLHTGVRRGELLSLKWENINFSFGTLTVEGEAAKSGKTRHIPLNKEALHTLTLWCEQCDIDSGWVFFNKAGRQLTDIKKAWTNILIKAEIENFRWHDLRHTFASRLVMAGVDLNTVRELLGHSDIKMTLRYAHLTPEYKAQAVAKLDGFWDAH